MEFWGHQERERHSSLRNTGFLESKQEEKLERKEKREDREETDGRQTNHAIKMIL